MGGNLTVESLQDVEKSSSVTIGISGGGTSEKTDDGVTTNDKWQERKRRGEH